jgi:hypothetical protein
MPAWGYGKVLELMGENKGRVFFLLAGEKKMSWQHAGLDLVGGDNVSQAALNEQLVAFKLKLARDVLASEGPSQEVTCTPCDSLSSRCEVCNCASESLRIYSLTQEAKMCLCGVCRNKIILETRDRAEVIHSITKTEERSNKKIAERGKKRKLRKVGE